jgi:hypothetical protein
MPSLSLPRAECGYIPQQDRFTKDQTFKFKRNDVSLFPGDYQILSHKAPKSIEQITFSEKRGEIIAEIISNNRSYNLHISLDGVDRLSMLHVADDLPEMVYASGVWTNEDTLKITLRFLETCFTVSYIIQRQAQGIELTAPGWRFPGEKITESVRICSI